MLRYYNDAAYLSIAKKLGKVLATDDGKLAVAEKGWGKDIIKQELHPKKII
ncbi:MAG: hypothetical protein ACPLY9_01120 [Nitrososphaerales archaeon]